MSDLWKNWEGQVADHKYQLQRFVGSTDHSVVFLAEFHDPGPRQAAIKFVSADVAHRDQQLAAWEKAAQLKHPSLIQIYGSGLCQIEETDLLYVAMEFAEENLAQVLPHRALTANETKEMLNAVSDVLVFLHRKDLTHGHVKPSNILASGDSLKLSSDTIVRVGEVREVRRERSSYDAPEWPVSTYTPAADIWSLGVTLVEALSQQPAVLPFDEQADPVIPSTIREPFLEIARNTLKREPRSRWSSIKIAERLNPAVGTKSAAAAAGARAKSAVASAAQVATAVTEPVRPAVSPLSVPLSQERAVPLTKQPAAAASRRSPIPPVREEGISVPQTISLPNYVLPLFAGLFVVIALVLLPFVLHHRTAPDATAKTVQSTAATPREVAARPTNAVSPPTNVPSTEETPVEPTAAPTRTQPANPAPTLSLRDKANSSGSAAKNSASPAKGEALDQVKPQASAKALSTIQGTVRVGVKVHVDTAGNVSEAKLENSGPSRYFADLSLKAARQWVFTPPEADGRSVASDWLIRFHFTQSGVQLASEQLTP